MPYRRTRSCVPAGKSVELTFGLSLNSGSTAVAVQRSGSLLRSDSPAYKALEHNEVSKLLNKPVPFFEVRLQAGAHQSSPSPVCQGSNDCSDP